MRRSRRFRRMLLVILPLVLSVVTTVGVAWGLAFCDLDGVPHFASRQVSTTTAWSNPFLQDQPPGSLSLLWLTSPGRMILLGNAVGTEPHDEVFLGTPGMVPPRTRHVEAPEQLVARWAGPHVLSWTMGSTPWPRPSDREWREAEARGWPFLALFFEQGQAPNYSNYTRGGWRLPVERAEPHKPSFARIEFRSEHNVILPLLPIWPGLAADVAFYGLAWAVLLYSPLVVVRRLRRTRGGCPKCGYTLEGLPPGAPCPECGRGAGNPDAPRMEGCHPSGAAP